MFVDGKRLKSLTFLGDQLTVERVRSAQRSRIASNTDEECLNGLQSAASDWLAEANFLQVSHNVIIYN